MSSPVAVELAGYGGVTLRGDLWLPSVPGPAPGVVMAHGFSAVRTMALPEYAEAFATAGLAVLAYDHRNLGDSDGEPRQEINPWAQARDLRHALTWLAERPEVDADRLGLWGSSFSGGEAIVVAAVDRRVKAVVANVPWVGSGGGSGDEAADRVTLDAIAADLADETGAGLADAPGPVMGPFAVVDDGSGRDDVFLRQPESAAWFLD